MRHFSALPTLLALTLLASPGVAESLLDAPAGLEPADPPPAGRSGRLVPVPDVPAARDVEPGPDLLDRNGDGVADGLAARLEGAPANRRFDVIAAFTTRSRAAAALQALGPADVRHEYDLIPGFAATLTAGQVNALTRMPGVVRVEEVAPVHAFLEAERRDFGVDAAQVDQSLGVDGTGVGICIVDTGVFAAQEQLDSKDITFVDFVGTSLEPYDDQGHGTHVASIAAGDGTAAAGGDQAGAALYRGVAPGASIYAAKVLNSAGEGTSDDVIAGVEWCANQDGVDVINLSLGEVGSSDGSDLLSQAIDTAANEGLVVVVAAGNSGAGPYTIGSPAAARLAITAGAAAEWSASAEAVGESDGIYIAPFSSRGPTADNRVKPDVVAPGVSVIAGYIDPTGSGGFGCTTDCYTSLSGTSMAAPFTAGTVALILEADPSLAPAEVKALLAETATDRGPSAGDGIKDDDWGHGLLDAQAAVAAAAFGLGETPTAFPSHDVGTGQVAGSTATQVPIPVDDTSAPLAVAMTILDGEPQLFCDIFLGCFYEWRPDFDVRLRDPNGNIVAEGFCMLGSIYGFECDNVGRQETVHIPTPLRGTYTLEVYKGTSDSANGSFRYEVSRGPLVGSSSAPANQPPVANDDETTTPYETAVTIDVLANDDDPDDGPDPLSVVEITQPADGTAVLNQDQTITFTPDAEFFGLTGFDYRASDGADVSQLASVSITVGDPPNQPPVANDDAATTSRGTPVTIEVLANDTDPDGDVLSIQSVGVASHGRVTATDASVRYEPNTDYVGSDTFEYTVRDGHGGIDTGTVTVTVEDTPPPPEVTVHVGDLDGSSTNNGKTWEAAVTVAVHQNGGHEAVAGAVVSGIWSLAGGNLTCTTGAAGTCQIALGGNPKKQGSVTFTVTGVSSGVGDYVSGENHDPDGDSVDGTSITVSKP